MTDRPIRPGVLHHLVKQLGTPSRVKLQKMSYLLQEGLGAGTGYRFKMHHYGPNSDELTNVMDWMRATGYLEIWNEKDSRAYLVIVKREPEKSGRRLRCRKWKSSTNFWPRSRAGRTSTWSY